MSVLINHFPSFVDEPTIVLHVGEAKAAFRIHRKLICDASAMFRSVFLGNGTFAETEDQSMTLPEDDIETVTRFVQWLYGQDYELAPTTDASNTKKCYEQLARLYVFADKYGVDLLHNEIIDKLFDMKDHGVTPPHIRLVSFIYQNTTVGSSFRKLLVAYYVFHIAMKWYSEDLSKTFTAMPEFSADLALGFARRIAGTYTSPYSGPSSKFHVAPKVTDLKS